MADQDDGNDEGATFAAVPPLDVSLKLHRSKFSQPAAAKAVKRAT